MADLNKRVQDLGIRIRDALGDLPRADVLGFSFVPAEGGVYIGDEEVPVSTDAGVSLEPRVLYENGDPDQPVQSLSLELAEQIVSCESDLLDALAQLASEYNERLGHVLHTRDTTDSRD